MHWAMGLSIFLGYHLLFLMRVRSLVSSQTGLANFVCAAHHCKGRYAANKIMQDFYHPERLKSGADSVPHILGLTASPGSDPEEMRLEKKKKKKKKKKGMIL